MENCSPIGTPTEAIRLMVRILGLRSPRCRRSAGTFLAMYTTQATPAMAWESTVAQAAPSTPMPSFARNSRSRTTLTVTAATRKPSGVRLSPRARSSPAARLYSMVKPVPIKMIKIYRYASSKISAGVSIRRRISPVQRAVQRVIKAVTIAPSQITCPVRQRTFSSSPAPKLCATGIVKPEQAPCAKPRIRKFSAPVAPTAAKELTPRMRPTRMLSARL